MRGKFGKSSKARLHTSYDPPPPSRTVTSSLSPPLLLLLLLRLVSSLDGATFGSSGERAEPHLAPIIGDGAPLSRGQREREGWGLGWLGLGDWVALGGCEGEAEQRRPGGGFVSLVNFFFLVCVNVLLLGDAYAVVWGAGSCPNSFKSSHWFIQDLLCYVLQIREFLQLFLSGLCETLVMSSEFLEPCCECCNEQWGFVIFPTSCSVKE